MDDVDYVFDVLDALEAVEWIHERAPVRRRDRHDPFELYDLEFKGRYRFSKANVQRLTTMLAPFLEKQNIRGLPFTPLQIVCAGLHYLGGDHFQRVEVVCAGSSNSTAQNMIYRYITIVIIGKVREWVIKKHRDEKRVIMALKLDL